MNTDAFGAITTPRLDFYLYYYIAEVEVSRV